MRCIVYLIFILFFLLWPFRNSYVVLCKIQSGTMPKNIDVLTCKGGGYLMVISLNSERK